MQCDAPGDVGNSAVTGYTVTVSPGGKTYAVGGTTRALTVTGLTNNTAYTFAVRARNAAGLGPARAVRATPRAQHRLFVTVDVSNDGRADIIGVTRGNIAYIYRGNGAGGISGGTRVGSGLGDLRALLPAWPSRTTTSSAATSSRSPPRGGTRRGGPTTATGSPR